MISPDQSPSPPSLAAQKLPLCDESKLRTLNRNVLILAICQAMLFTGIGLVISSSALIGKELAPEFLARIFHEVNPEFPAYTH